MKSQFRRFLSVALVALLTLMAVPSIAQAQTYYARGFGRFAATNYGAWGGSIVQGNTTTGAVTITILLAPNLPDGRPSPPPYIGQVVSVDISPNNENVTLTSASATSCPGQAGTCFVLGGTFNNTHGPASARAVASSTGGLQEAIYDAWTVGGGIVTIDGTWNGTSAMLSAAPVFSTISIEDTRFGTPRFWNPTPNGLALAVPTALTAQAACDATHTFCSDATVAGSASYAGGALYGCVAYVDIMGNEGPCSTTANFTDVSTKAIDVGVPAASAGAVGYVVYLSLDAGTYAQAYQIPSLATNCTLTKLETILPACAVANTSYSQLGSTFGANALFTGGSQIATYPVSTGLHFTTLASVVQTTVSLTPMTNSSVTYAYSPSSRVGGCPGTSSWNQTQEIAAGGISASSTTGIPMSMGTWTIPAGCFNYVGAEFRISGKIRETASGASDALKVIVAWDAAGTNTTTVPTTLCNIANTHTEAAAQQTAWYSCTVRILTTGATGTALVNGGGFFDIATGAAGVLIGPANDTAVAASGSINLTVPARISVRFSNTGSTVTNGQPLEGTFEAIN